MASRNVWIRFLENAYILSSRVIGADTLLERRYGAALVICFWQVLIGLNLVSVVEKWIYPISAFYLEFWPFRSDNVRSFTNTYAGYFLVMVLVSLPLTIRTARRCSNAVRVQPASWSQQLVFGGLVFTEGLGALLNRLPIGTLGLLLFHAALVLWFARLSVPQEHATV